MARKPKSTTGAAASQDQTAGGAVSQEQLAVVRQQPDVNAAVITLQPFTNGVLNIVRGLSVRNETERHVMADLLRQIKTAQGIVGERFGSITKPMWQAWRAVKDWENQVGGPLEDAETEAKQKLGEYALAQQKERERLEGERREREREVREREQREREYPQPLPQPFTQSAAPTEYINMSARITGWDHRPEWESAPTLPPAHLTSAPLSGVTTTFQWGVEVVDENAAVAALIAGGVWDLRGALGVAGAFVRLDVSALNIAARGDGEVARVVRGLLAQVPGLKVEERAVVRSKGYE